MSSEVRNLHLLGATGQIRVARHDDREHLVVPVVALMEGVIHAINAETPELVPLTSLQSAPQGWNGRPIVLGHPTLNGRQISANSPRVLEEQAFGTVFNTRVENGKLLMDAYIDIAKAEKLGAQEMLENLRANKMTEVSVGAFVVTEPTAGVHNAKPYKAIWRDITPDHLAFLPKGVGACSIEMGCGSCRAAAAHLVTAEGTLETLIGNGNNQYTKNRGSASSSADGPSVAQDIRTQVIDFLGEFEDDAHMVEVDDNGDGSFSISANISNSKIDSDEIRSRVIDLLGPTSVDALIVDVDDDGIGGYTLSANYTPKQKRRTFTGEVGQRHPTTGKVVRTPRDPMKADEWRARKKNRNAQDGGPFMNLRERVRAFINELRGLSAEDRSLVGNGNNQYTKNRGRVAPDTQDQADFKTKDGNTGKAPDDYLGGDDSGDGPLGPVAYGQAKFPQNSIFGDGEVTKEHLTEAQHFLMKEAPKFERENRSSFDSGRQMGAEATGLNFVLEEANAYDDNSDRAALLAGYLVQRREGKRSERRNYRKGRWGASVYDSPEQIASEEAAELIGYKTLETLIEQLGESYEAAEDIIGELIDTEENRPTNTNAAEQAETEIEEARLESVRVLCMSMYSVLNAVLGLTNDMLRRPDQAEVGVATDVMPRYAAGARHSAEDRKIIQGVHDHAVNLGASCSEMKAAAEGTTMPCGCKGESKMTKEAKAELIKSLVSDKNSGFTPADEKMLEAAPDERLEAFKAAAATRADEVKAAEATVKAAEAAKEAAELKAAEAAKPKTEDEYLKDAPESIRTLVAEKKASDAAAKADLVGKLKGLGAFTEEELNAKSNQELSKLVQLAGIQPEEPANFAGRGVPRAAAGTEDVYANPPDPYAAALTARKAAESVN